MNTRVCKNCSDALGVEVKHDIDRFDRSPEYNGMRYFRSCRASMNAKRSATSRRNHMPEHPASILDIAQDLRLALCKPWNKKRKRVTKALPHVFRWSIKHA